MSDIQSLESLRQSIVDMVLPRTPYNKSPLPKCQGDEDLLDQWKDVAHEECLFGYTPSAQLPPQLVALMSTNMVTHNLEGVPKPFASDGNNLLVHVPSLLQQIPPTENINAEIAALLLSGVRQHIGVSLTGQGEIALSSDLWDLCQEQHPNLKWDEETARQLLGNQSNGRTRLLHAFSQLCDPQAVMEYAPNALDPSALDNPPAPSDASVATEQWLPVLSFLNQAIPLSLKEVDLLSSDHLHAIVSHGAKTLGASEEKLAWTLIFANITQVNPKVDVGRSLLHFIKNTDMAPMLNVIQHAIDGSTAAATYPKQKEHSIVGNDFSSFMSLVFHATTTAGLLNLVFHKLTVSSNPYPQPSLEQLAHVHQQAFQNTPFEEMQSNPNMLARMLLFSPLSAKDIQEHFSPFQWSDINQKIIKVYCDIANRNISILFNNASSIHDKTSSLDAIVSLSSSLLSLPMSYSKNQVNMLSEISERLKVFADDRQGTQWHKGTLESIKFIDASLSKYVMIGEMGMQDEAHPSEVVAEKPKKRM